MTSARPRWCYVTAVRLGAAGGQTTRVLESCRELGRLRSTALIAAAPPPSPLPQVAFRQVALPDRAPRELVFQLRLARDLLRPEAGARPDIIFSVATAFNLGLILAARRLGARCVVELNGLPAMEYRLERHGRDARARALYYTLVERLERRLVDAVVAVTPQLAAEARRQGARATLVTRNGANPSAFAPQDRRAARRAAGLPEDTELVGFAGNFAAWQGLEALVRGAALLADSRPRLQLLLIGDGVERPRLEELAAPLGERARFAGRVPYQQVAGMLAACDVLAAPFAPIPRNLRMGISALKLSEYLALGRPILGSRLPGMEFIANEGFGALFRAGDAADLASRLGALLDLGGAEREAIGARARAAAEGHYSWRSVVEDIVAFAEGL